MTASASETKDLIASIGRHLRSLRRRVAFSIVVGVFFVLTSAFFIHRHMVAHRPHRLFYVTLWAVLGGGNLVVTLVNVRTHRAILRTKKGVR